MKVFVLKLIDDDHTVIEGVYSKNNLAMTKGQKIILEASEIKRKGNPFGGGVYDMPKDPATHAAYDLWLEKYFNIEGITGYVVSQFEIDCHKVWFDRGER